ncbi:MAG: 1-acyl-sn-glycerol-3-phosphate acyltransferase, partial [Chloroflexi bacterium]|nr:1-acyl-sn-glycerol-3-phosphate acyltransferase [Chloroflexota bacterium]
MNIFKPQKPYHFYPPRYRPYLAPLLAQFSRSMMRCKFKVREVHVEGLGEVARLAAAGQSLLIAPNHADHADPHVLLYAGRKGGMAFHFMAAREGFEKSRLAAFTLQRMGAFSVDREGADIAAVKTAMQIMGQGVHPLVIFPEGEIYHHHERLDDLNEGVATILLRASTKVPPGRMCYAVPTAIRYVYDPEVSKTFSE